VDQKFPFISEVTNHADITYGILERWQTSSLALAQLMNSDVGTYMVKLLLLIPGRKDSITKA